MSSDHILKKSTKYILLADRDRKSMSEIHHPDPIKHKALENGENLMANPEKRARDREQSRRKGLGRPKKT
jgi:hypothetical protein